MDLDQVGCKVDNFQGTWSSPTPDSPVENPFGENAVYPLGALSSSLIRQEVGWSPQNSNMGRRLQSDTRPSIQSHSTGRWQGTSPYNSLTTPSSTSSLYQERNRIRSGHPFDDGQMIRRRENEGVQTNDFPHRYNPHPNGTREGALQRLQWREVPAESGRDHRRVNSAQTNHSFPHLPTLPFNSQSYHLSATPTYRTQSDSKMLTPTLHPNPSIQSNLSYDGSYPSNVSSAPIPSPSPEEYPTNIGNPNPSPFCNYFLESAMGRFFHYILS